MTIPHDRLRAAGEPLKLALWFGLMAGTARALHYIVMRTASNQLIWDGDQTVWLAPAGHAAFFAMVALPLSGVALVAPRMAPRRTLATVFATLALFSVLLLFPRIHHVASLVFALGGGLQLAALMSRAPRRTNTLLNRVSAVLVAANVLAAVGIPLFARRVEERMVRSLPHAANDAPNVLLIILDATRAKNMSVYGYGQRTTPNIEHVGAQGVVFERAMSTTAWTLPSVASMMTGQYPTSLSTDWLAPLDRRFPVLAERLLGRGYLTGGFSANLNYMSRETGIARGFTRFVDVRPSINEMLLTVSLVQSDLVREARRALLDRNGVALIRALARFNWNRSTSTPTHQPKLVGDVMHEFLDWQRGSSGRPWFAMLNFIDAHKPYKPQPPFDTLFGDRAEAAYDGAIATLDNELGKLFAELRRRESLDQTIVVVTADHGEHFGEHGMWEHGNTLYLPVIHVPLVIRAPSLLPAGVRVRQPVSLRDLAPTLLELVDPASRYEPELGGRSLRSTWDPEFDGEAPSPAASALTVMGWRRSDEPMRWFLTSLVDDSLHYIRYHEERELLFDVRSDPDELHSIIDTPSGRRVADLMRIRLDSALLPEQ